MGDDDLCCDLLDGASLELCDCEAGGEEAECEGVEGDAVERVFIFFLFVFLP